MTSEADAFRERLNDPEHQAWLQGPVLREFMEAIWDQARESAIERIMAAPNGTFHNNTVRAHLIDAINAVENPYAPGGGV